MKKLLALFMVIAMVLSLAACTTSEESSSKKKGAASISAPITFQETVVVDNDACTIKITEVDPDGRFGYSLSVYLENKTENTNLMFSVTSASTNGVTNDPFWAASVDAGKKSNETITFMDTDLAEIIGDYTDIALSFRVYDNDDYMADPVAEPTVRIYPYGEDKAVTYTRQSQETDTVILENDKVSAIVIGYEEDDILGYVANVYLLNNTDVPVMFAVDSASVNGYMADPYFATIVEAGTCAFAQISWSDSTLSENNIENVEEIELTLRAYDSENWLADDFANETVTLYP